MKLLSILLKRFSLLSKLCTQQNVLVFLCNSHIYKSCTEIASSTHEYQFKSFFGLIFFKNHIFFSIQEQSPSGTKNTIECVGAYTDVTKLSLVNKVLMSYLCCHGYWHQHDTPVTSASSQGFPSKRLDAKLTF